MRRANEIAKRLNAGKPQAQHSPLPRIDWIVQGKIDGALVDQNGIYVSPSQTIAVLRKLAKQRDEARYHAQALAEALRDIRDCAFDPWQVAGVDKSDTTALVAFASRVYNVAKAALARWEEAK